LHQKLKPLIFEQEKLVHSMGSHPYYPIGVEIRNYVPNSKSAFELVSTIGISFVVVIGSCWVILGRHWSAASKLERLKATWFIFCGLLHLIFEG
jgi:cholestenol delta-isomerase